MEIFNFLLIKYISKCIKLTPICLNFLGSESASEMNWVFMERCVGAIHEHGAAGDKCKHI